MLQNNSKNLQRFRDAYTTVVSELEPSLTSAFLLYPLFEKLLAKYNDIYIEDMPADVESELITGLVNSVIAEEYDLFRRAHLATSQRHFNQPEELTFKDYIDL